MTIEEEIFKRSIPDYNCLVDYGFIRENDTYTYATKILNDSFQIIINVSEKGVTGKIFDLESETEYLTYRIENQSGEFASSIREIYKAKLADIKKCCFLENYFIHGQANRITKLIKEEYNVLPEFLWKDDEKNGVFRNNYNKKWFGIIMNINKNKISTEDKDIEVLNIKLDDKKITDLLKKPGFFQAYHMNKKYWITIILDSTITDEEIMCLIRESYSYTVTTNEWVVPANPKYYDVVNCFNNTNHVIWKQSSSIKVGDIVYLYVGAPYSCIMFKCKAVKTNIPYNYQDSNLTISMTMDLELLETYPHDKLTFKIISDYGLTSIRGPRRMPKKLLDYIKNAK